MSLITYAEVSKKNVEKAIQDRVKRAKQYFQNSTGFINQGFIVEAIESLGRALQEISFLSGRYIPVFIDNSKKEVDLQIAIENKTVKIIRNIVVSIVEGNRQVGYFREPLHELLKVHVKWENKVGNKIPVNNAKVIFYFKRGSGVLASISGERGENEILVKTNNDGIATCFIEGLFTVSPNVLIGADLFPEISETALIQTPEVEFSIDSRFVKIDGSSLLSDLLINGSSKENTYFDGDSIAVLVKCIINPPFYVYFFQITSDGKLWYRHNIPVQRKMNIGNYKIKQTRYGWDVEINKVLLGVESGEGIETILVVVSKDRLHFGTVGSRPLHKMDMLDVIKNQTNPKRWDIAHISFYIKKSRGG